MPSTSGRKRFDLVLLMHALTYSDKPAAVVAEAARVLRQGRPPARCDARQACASHGGGAVRSSQPRVSSRPSCADSPRAPGSRCSAASASRAKARPPHFEVISPARAQAMSAPLPWLQPERVAGARTRAARAHPGHRWRHGHDDPGPSPRRSRLSRRALRRRLRSPTPCPWRRLRSHDLKGNNDLLSLTRPDIIRGIHDAYLEAGADLVETNTFNATSISQADYHLSTSSTSSIAKARDWRAPPATRSARKTPDKPRFVIGVLGPTSRTASISPDVNDPGFRNTNFDELRGDLPRSDRRPDRRRRRHAHGRNHLRHAQRQGGAVRDRRGVRANAADACR